MYKMTEEEMIDILRDNILEEIDHHLNRAVRLFDDLKEIDPKSVPKDISTAYGNVQVFMEYVEKNYEKN